MTGEPGVRPLSLDNDMSGQPTGIMPRNEHGWSAGSCSICTLPEEQLLALNLILADPNQWPRNIFKGIKLPAGALPAGYRLWGAVKMALAWADEQNLVINKKAMRKHYTGHVVQVPASAAQFAENAMVSEGDSRLAKPMLDINPVNFRKYYGKGIALGEKALDMAQAQLEYAEAEGLMIPLDVLLKVADLGTKLAKSAAELTQRGMELDREKEDEMAGFRAGSMPAPSQRIGHYRIRTIEGEARPVVDEGRGDRRDYNDKAREQGNATLPA